jgi:hypothetical protein
MSHRAVNWALEQPDLKPGPWVVLIKLADRHNKDTFRVDPEQSLLASDCNMSRSTVNLHLDKLESLGLLVRVPRVNPRTQKQLSTFYVLECDFKNPPDVEFAVSDYRTRIKEAQTENTDAPRVLKSDTVAVSEKTHLPCPKKRHSRVRKPDTNHVREPVKEPCASETDPQTNAFSKDLTEQLLELHPRPGDPIETEAALKKAIAAGTSPEVIISGARAYAEEQKGNSPRYVAYSQNWVTRKGWVPFAPKSAADISANAEAVNTRWANWIKAKAVSAVHCSPRVAHQLCLDGKVTVAECRAAGINL